MRLLFSTIPFIAALAVVALLHDSGSAEACAGLIGSNGAVNLGRTTTLAAYDDGVEHYVTAFQFQGGGGEFGTLIPLPGVPTKVERGGGWTLQRLQLETQVLEAASGTTAGGGAGGAGGAVTILETKIDALDITVLEGGGPDVAVWAEEHGFRLSPDAPEVLDFYAARSPIFLAAVFDGAAAAERGQQIGDGTPVHITIPTSNPWVPLRILGLGKQAADQIEADVFLLTDDKPALLPRPGSKMALAYSQAASDTLLSDLRSDENSEWVPQKAWLTKLAINSPTSNLRFDLAVDASGQNKPSQVAAGLVALPRTGGQAADGDGPVPPVVWALGAVAALGVVAIFVRRRSKAGGAS
jgi:MYXO-CTERM domain-containing protein